MLKREKINNSEIAVLDAGGQYCHLISRKIRELGARAEVLPSNTPSSKLENYCGIVISGGPASVYEFQSPKVDKDIFNMNIPILGICYGHQMMAHLLGGEVKAGKVGEYGISNMKILTEDSLFKGLNREEAVWMSHMDTVERPPTGFKRLGSTKECNIAAMGNIDKKYFGIQFHPEVIHTPNGNKILNNFVFKICECDKKWNPKDKVKEIKEKIRKEVKDRNVFFFISGGVDSTVAFSLCLQALGQNRVKGYYVDTGFMRKNEKRQVQQLFKKELGITMQAIDASDEFFQALKKVCDPEKKRRIIGNKFVEIQKKTISSLKNLKKKEWILGQGTIYPDTIESGGTENSALIKTHHNRVDLIKKLISHNKIIEPLSNFYKDEVRKIGTKIGLPHDIVYKHPFPGPGLATRTLCSSQDILVNKDSKEIAHFLDKYNLDSFTLPIRSVGVQGDKRTYQKVAVLHGRADFEILEEVSTSITNNVMSINRIAYLLRPKLIQKNTPLRIKKSFLNRKRINLLSEVDYIVMQLVEKHGLTKDIWQFPVILLPLTIKRGEFIVLRPIHSVDGMTAQFFQLPKTIIEELCEEILKVKGIDGILYDVTNKPPATIEWE